MVVIDFTTLRGMFRSVVVGAVIDVFTRQVLAIHVWPKEPDAASTTRLLQRTRLTKSTLSRISLERLISSEAKEISPPYCCTGANAGARMVPGDAPGGGLL
jgi:hypothetical protein